LAPIFAAVGEALLEQRQALNQADPYNGDHGDHMVEVFGVAAQAAREKSGAGLAEAMEYAAGLLAGLAGNGSAQVYAHGLAQVAAQLRRYEVSLEELSVFVQKALEEEGGESAASAEPRSGEVLKALLAGLAGWGQIERGQTPSGNPLDMAALFDLGVAYMQAKGRGGSRAEVLAEAAASASPLGSVPHRRQSGKIAIQAFLGAIARGRSGGSPGGA
jgi:hypothetical protein